MSRNMIKKVSLRFALILVSIALMLIAYQSIVYADDEEMIPEKNADGVYEIYNADQLEVYMRITGGQSYTAPEGTVVAADEGSSCILMNDIDYTGSTLSPQEGAFFKKPYTGTLDGNGKTIKNVPNTFAPEYVNNTGALICKNNGTLKNFALDFGEITLNPANTVGGILVGENQASGTISGITIKGDITSLPNANQYVFCNVNYGLVMSCSAHGTLTSSTSNFNYTALIGQCSGDGQAFNIYNAMDITVTGGGIPCGICRSGSSAFKNCYCIGTLKQSTTVQYRLAYNNETAMVNCYQSTAEITAEKLGPAFTDDLEAPDSVNKGYPVFPYQIGGQYPRVEGPEDLEIKEIKGVSDTSISYTTDTVYTYFVLKASDITVRVINESGKVVDITPTDLSWGSKSTTLSYPSISENQDIAGFDAQDVIVQIVVKGKVKGETTLELQGSDDWRDYEKEPELLGLNDDRYGGKYGGYYMITSPEELAWFANHNNSGDNAFLTNDIDLGAHTWYGIGNRRGSTAVASFIGIFDGNGYKISNLHSVNGTGLVARLYGAATIVSIIKNVCLKNVDISGDRAAGGIAMNMSGGRIESCSVSGNISSTGGTTTSINYGTGGIVGTVASTSSYITNCVNSAAINAGTPEYAGGIAGYARDLTIENCYNMGSVNGGGIIGSGATSGNYANITNCYNAGKVESGIANSTYCNINDCYSQIGSGRITGGVNAFSKNDALDGTLLEYLGDEFAADGENINSGYPVLMWQSPLTKAKEQYPNEIRYYVDLDEYKLNKDEIQEIIDEAIQKIEDATSSSEADAALAEAKAKIDAIPSDKQVKQNMADALAELQGQLDLLNKTLAFDMCMINIDKTTYAYDGSALEPIVEITTKDGTALTKDTDYEVRYEGNIDPGLAKVIVSGKGSYAGDREVTFTITPAQVQGLKLKKAKKAFTVKWTKDENASGYQVSYGLKKTFKGAKTVKITKNSTVSKKISKLKAKKKYFVRVRAYVTSGGQTIYGAWSPVKSVKTK